MAESNISDDMKHCYENLILIDASANLTNKKYSRDLDLVIQRAQDSGRCTQFFLLVVSSFPYLFARNMRARKRVCAFIPIYVLIDL